MDNQDDSPHPQDAGHTGGEARPAPEPADEAPKPVDIDGKKALLAGGILLLVILVVVAIVVVAKHSSSSSDSTTDTTKAKLASVCGKGDWPKLYSGEPKNLAAGTDTGYYVWFDTKGWHLRAIDTASATTFKGTIALDTAVADAKKFTMTPADAGTVEVKGNTVSFSFAGGPAAKGLDFSPCASGFRVSMGTETLPWPVESIYVGASNKAVTNPIVVTRS